MADDSLLERLAALEHRIGSVEQRLLGMEGFQLSTVEELAGIRVAATTVKETTAELKDITHDLQDGQTKNLATIQQLGETLRSDMQTGRDNFWAGQEKLRADIQTSNDRFRNDIGVWARWIITSLIALGVVQFAMSGVWHR